MGDGRHCPGRANHVRAAGDGAESGGRGAGDAKERICLGCEKPFPSQSRFNRYCEHCHESQRRVGHVWRVGVRWR